MIDSKTQRSTSRKFGYSGLLLALLLAVAIPASSQGDRKTETIDAQAMGTSTQLGRNIGIKVIINQFSTPEDRHWPSSLRLRRASTRVWSKHSRT